MNEMLSMNQDKLEIGKSIDITLKQNINKTFLLIISAKKKKIKKQQVAVAQQTAL